MVCRLRDQEPAEQNGIATPGMDAKKNLRSGGENWERGGNGKEEVTRKEEGESGLPVGRCINRWPRSRLGANAQAIGRECRLPWRLGQ